MRAAPGGSSSGSPQAGGVGRPGGLPPARGDLVLGAPGGSSSGSPQACGCRPAGPAGNPLEVTWCSTALRVEQRITAGRRVSAGQAGSHPLEVTWCSPRPAGRAADHRRPAGVCRPGGLPPARGDLVLAAPSGSSSAAPQAGGVGRPGQLSTRSR
ncbi:MAG: hypothetical protein AVDCRST_MAG16-2076 [uncultured Frankineae bacterium]|uniref:Uncharacterized protein n=1 Tax=uncultured Frankineae bacterium TaxID=437475 RepID=A0A6J4M017_9ACTN|nr:MAG: hypothetical protein AVDCRST_MAG16-2076 [uncultured Frankineae bacterium]